MTIASLATRTRSIAAAFALFLLSAFASIPAIAEEPYVHPAEVKSAMYDMVRAIETVLSLDSKASDKVFYSDPEIWGNLKDKTQILRAAQDFRKFRDSGYAVLRSPLASRRVQSIGSSAFQPNYPLPDINYTVMLAFGMVTHPITSERTNPAGWIKGLLPEPYDQLGWIAYVSAVKSAGEALAIAQFACTVGTCFPLACAIVCVPVEVLAAAYQVLTIPLKCANAWDAQIDSAEIQAGYRNAVLVLGDLSTHDDRQSSALATHAGALATHDAWVRANLEKGSADMTKLLNEMLATIVANQKEIIKLLKTPEGKRPGWGKEGY